MLLVKWMIELTYLRILIITKLLLEEAFDGANVTKQ